LSPLVLVQAALLLGFVGCSAVLARWDTRPWAPIVRSVATVAVIFTLYTSLGKLGVAAMPYLADAGLSRADNALLGFDPSLALQRFQTPGTVEFFSFIYAFFIPYINLSLFLGCLGRPPLEREQFMTGWVFTYAISYLGANRQRIAQSGRSWHRQRIATPKVSQDRHRSCQQVAVRRSLGVQGNCYTPDGSLLSWAWFQA
jgi:hypothetical protein